MEKRITRLIREYPGLHLREVARQLDTSVALVEYHVETLVQQGTLKRVAESGAHHLYPSGIANDPRMRILRNEKRLHICLVLLRDGASRHTDLVQETGIGKGTLSFQLRKLTDAALVTQQNGLYQLVDELEVRTFLERARPTPNLLDRFADVWGDLYD